MEARHKAILLLQMLRLPLVCRAPDALFFYDDATQKSAPTLHALWMNRLRSVGAEVIQALSPSVSSIDLHNASWPKQRHSSP